MARFKMSVEEWGKIQRSSNTCVMGMVMDYRNDRISSSEFFDIIADHCERAYDQGVKRGRREFLRMD